MRTILFTELFYGGHADVQVDRAVKMWQKDIVRVDAGVGNPLEVPLPHPVSWNWCITVCSSGGCAGG